MIHLPAITIGTVVFAVALRPQIACAKRRAIDKLSNDPRVAFVVILDAEVAQRPIDVCLCLGVVDKG